ADAGVPVLRRVPDTPPAGLKTVESAEALAGHELLTRVQDLSDDWAVLSAPDRDESRRVHGLQLYLHRRTNARGSRLVSAYIGLGSTEDVLDVAVEVFRLSWRATPSRRSF